VDDLLTEIDRRILAPGQEYACLCDWVDSADLDEPYRVPSSDCWHMNGNWSWPAARRTLIPLMGGRHKQPLIKLKPLVDGADFWHWRPADRGQSPKARHVLEVFRLVEMKDEQWAYETTDEYPF
jgi:hypothetical protein